MTHPHKLDRTPLDEGSAHCRDLYLTTHNTHTPCPGRASERPQTYALDRAATGISPYVINGRNFSCGKVTLKQHDEEAFISNNFENVGTA